MAVDSSSLQRSVESLAKSLVKRRRHFDRFLLLALVAIAIAYRYGIDAFLTYVALPLVILTLGHIVSEVLKARSTGDPGATGQTLFEHLPRMLICLIVGGVILGRIIPADPAETAGTNKQCQGLAAQTDPACDPTPAPGSPGPAATVDTTTSTTPAYVPTTTVDPGRSVPPTCPPENGTARRLSFDSPPPFCLDRSKDYVAKIATNYGTFEIALNMERAPWTVNNFAFLAGWHFYDGVTLAASEPFVDATSLYVGDPVSSSDASKAPGYGITFDPMILPYPESAYVVMLDQKHPNRFAIVISDEGRADIERNPSAYPLLGEVTQGLDVVAQDSGSRKGPRFTSETIVIDAVQVVEVAQSSTTTTR